jgi:probable HAF family extracellular repeat protein
MATDLGVLNGGAQAAANGINSLGWIVGMSEKRFGNDVWQRAALWRNGSVLDLGTFGGEYSEARGVSDAGHVVGWAWTPVPTRSQHAFVWTESGGMINLGVLGGWSHSSATDVNSNGVVVGSALTPTGYRAFKWSAIAGIQDLGVFPGTRESVCGGVNIHGQVVGYSYTFEDDCTVTTVPVMWDNGVIVSLQDAIAGPGWTLEAAIDINDHGEITGIANNRAVLLRPVVRGGCGTSDFNGDGDFGTDQDIESYFACLAGACCSTCFVGGADFNGDGDVGTDQDIDAFFRVLAGGNC